MEVTTTNQEAGIYGEIKYLPSLGDIIIKPQENF